ARSQCLEDTRQHLDYLAHAVASEDLQIFIAYLRWAKIVHLALNRNVDALTAQLQALQQLLRETPESAAAEDYLASALAQLPEMPTELPSFLTNNDALDTLANDYLALLLNGDRNAASRLILENVERGVAVRDLYLRVFQPAQYEVGRLWQLNQITVAQEHFCTAATQLIMSQLYANIFSTTRVGLKLVATAVSGDLHEVGIRMIADFFEMEGWDTLYLGSNLPTESVIATLRSEKPDLLAISATLTPHVHHVNQLIAAIRRHPDVAHTRILVGGYPFSATPNLWRHVGADATAADAQAAVEIGTTLVPSKACA
ncbi:MAG: cobalamin-dependent protein, partial [Phycisphaeraceae bacterium]